MKRHISLFVFGVLVFSSSYALALFGDTPEAKAAQGGTSITISPSTQKIDIIAGQTYKGKFTVYNTSEFAFTATFSVSPYHVSNGDYNADFTTINDYTTIKDWVHFSQDSVRIESGDKAVIAYDVVVPPKGSPTPGQYAVIFAETEPDPSTGGTSVTLSQRVGMLLFAKSAVGAKIEGEPYDLKVQSLYVDKEIDTTFKAINRGNVDAPANYSLNVQSLFGKEMYNSSTAKDAKSQSLILPQTYRTINQNWESVPTWGIYHVNLKADFNGNEQTKNSYVIVCPIWLLICIIAFIVLVIVTIVLMIVSKKRSKKKRADEHQQRLDEIAQAQAQATAMLQAQAQALGTAPPVLSAPSVPSAPPMPSAPPVPSGEIANHANAVRNDSGASVPPAPPVPNAQQYQDYLNWLEMQKKQDQGTEQGQSDQNE
jgi:hypothetical protein